MKKINMKTICVLFLAFCSLDLGAQTTQQYFVESYNLKKYAWAEDLTKTLLSAAHAGVLSAYDFENKKLGPDEIREQLIQAKGPEYPLWELGTYYYPQDRVLHKSQLWEAISDATLNVEPVQGDTWAKAYGGDLYFTPRDISVLKIQFNFINKTRHNIWVHLFVPADVTFEGVERYIFSFRFTEAEQFLNKTPLVFYQFSQPDLGLVSGNIFSFLDSYYQHGLKKALIQYAYSENSGCKIHSVVETSFEDVDLNYVQLEFLYSKNTIDSIRISYDTYVDNEPKRLADVPFKPFIKMVSSGTDSKFNGFHSFSNALNKILIPTKTDTIEMNFVDAQIGISTGKPKSLEGNTFSIVQQISYKFDVPQNRALLKEYEFGECILNAITSGRFKETYSAFKNDSLNSKLSNDELQDLIIEQRAPSSAPWDIGGEYYIGDRVMFQGNQYICQRDNVNINPAKSSEDWLQVISTDILYDPSSFKMLNLFYNITFNSKGMIQTRKAVAATISVFSYQVMIYRNIMTLDIETLKNILLDKSLGSTGSTTWDLIQSGKLSGVYEDNKPIRLVR